MPAYNSIEFIFHVVYFPVSLHDHQVKQALEQGGIVLTWVRTHHRVDVNGQTTTIFDIIIYISTDYTHVWYLTLWDGGRLLHLSGGCWTSWPSTHTNHAVLWQTSPEFFLKERITIELNWIYRISSRIRVLGSAKCVLGWVILWARSKTQPGRNITKLAEMKYVIQSIHA